MNHDLLALTTYFGERDAADGGFLGDALIAAYARRGLRASVLLRGASGFGVKHHLRTDRLPTLSEDLPLVTIAVDEPEPIMAAAEETVGRAGDGLITLERASTGAPERAPATGDEIKLTLFLGRGEHAHVPLVARLARHGVAGASVLLGVDGSAHGRRRRARFLGPNRHVPLIVLAVGAADRIAAALADIDAPARMVERVRVCKRDGVRLAAPHDDEASEPGMWHKLTVFCGEPLAGALVEDLRRAGAAGATALRGIWGYHGEHAPHGDTLWQLRRRVPVIVTTVDTPARSRDWFALIDRLTDAGGLVLSERVPAFRATGPGVRLGDLRLGGQPPV